MVRDRVVGVMDLESNRFGHFTEDHVRTLALLAPQIASSVENARLYEELAAREKRMEDDLQAARELQRVLLPDSAPEIEGLHAAVRLRPAREISGDIYDVFAHPDGQTVIAFGDVSGKGAAAALYGGLVSGLLRTLAPRRRRPAELLKALNNSLIERKVEARYVTLCVLLWDPAARRIVMANAGALPPMICRGAEILNVRVEGVPLGLLEEREYDETVFQTLGQRVWPRPAGAERARALRPAAGGDDRVDLQGTRRLQYHRVRRSDGVCDAGEVGRNGPDMSGPWARHASCSRRPGR